MLKEWLMQGDVSTQYLVLLEIEHQSAENLHKLRDLIALDGNGKNYLDHYHPETCMWEGIYSPKWTSTHYTLLQLKVLGINPSIKPYQDGCLNLISSMWQNKGKIRPYRHQDMCVVAMMLDLAAYGHLTLDSINEMVDYILEHQYTDGGWNCAWERGDLHSSLHTTLSVLEAFRDYYLEGYQYRIKEVLNAIPKAEEFILKKRLYFSERTGEIIRYDFTLFHYPVGWHYDVLRALEYFASVNHPYDTRMEDALQLVIARQKKDNTWSMCSPYPGKYYFRYGKTGSPSREITQRVLKVLQVYNPKLFHQIY